jgi:acetyl esterase/lipase
MPRKEYLNIPYASIAGVDPKYLTLDVYAPRDDRPHPVVLWLHGGAMKGGDKSHPAIAPVKSDFFLSRGFLFATANYRLAPEHRYPAQARDAAAAVSFLHDNVRRYGGDPNRLFLIGNSAGGQLAGIVSTNEEYLNQHGKSLAIIKGVVILDIGSFDVPSIFDQLGDRVPPMYRDTFGTDRGNWMAGSPFFHVAAGKKIPPFLLIYVDGRKHHRQENGRFAERLKRYGYSATVYAAKGKTHHSLALELGLGGDAPTSEIMAFFRGLMESHAAP